MKDQSRTSNRDVLGEQLHRQYANELREAGWIVLHESEFTEDHFHTDPYFRAAVTAIVRWYESPKRPPTPAEVSRIVELMKPVLAVLDKEGNGTDA